eukprot:2719291-Amphidinium_carterae.1
MLLFNNFISAGRSDPRKCSSSIWVHRVCLSAQDLGPFLLGLTSLGSCGPKTTQEYNTISPRLAECNYRATLLGIMIRKAWSVLAATESAKMDPACAHKVHSGGITVHVVGRLGWR